MTRLSTPSSFNLAWAIIGTTTIGMSLSMVLAQDTQWMQWHLSRLGEGGSLSAAIFNYTLIVIALIYVLLATRITDEVALLRHAKPTKLRLLMIITALCWAGVGMFPFDTFPVIHNIFGYGQFFIVCGTLLALRQLAPVFSEKTYIVGFSVVIISGLFMALFHLTHFTSLLVVELIGQLGVFVWLIAMTRDLRRRVAN
ncbi:hypothetical protein EOL96_00345 [Candidatus Saccharibacteria bacterium]|nr:hypothetical protein [Candidatus Saccharibacteria bacterium]